jgi:hypothetical protein
MSAKGVEAIEQAYAFVKKYNSGKRDMYFNGPLLYISAFHDYSYMDASKVIANKVKNYVTLEFPNMYWQGENKNIVVSLEDNVIYLELDGKFIVGEAKLENNGTQNGHQHKILSLLELTPVPKKAKAPKKAVKNDDDEEAKKACPEGKEVNPKTGRCIKIKEKASKKVATPVKELKKAATPDTKTPTLKGAKSALSLIVKAYDHMQKAKEAHKDAQAKLEELDASTHTLVANAMKSNKKSLDLLDKAMLANLDTDAKLNQLKEDLE